MHKTALNLSEPGGNQWSGVKTNFVKQPNHLSLSLHQQWTGTISHLQVFLAAVWTESPTCTYINSLPFSMHLPDVAKDVSALGREGETCRNQAFQWDQRYNILVTKTPRRSWHTDTHIQAYTRQCCQKRWHTYIFQTLSLTKPCRVLVCARLGIPYSAQTETFKHKCTSENSASPEIHPLLQQTFWNMLGNRFMATKWTTPTSYTLRRDSSSKDSPLKQTWFPL